MKTKSTLLLAVVLAMFQNIHAQQHQFQKFYGDNGTEYCYSVQQTTDGGFIVAGETDSYGAGNYDAYLIKTNSIGVIAWAKTYGDTAWNWANSVQQTTDGGYIVTGGTEYSGNGQGDIWIFKTDASGVIQWQKTSGGSGYDSGYDVRQTSDGGYIACGYQYGDASSGDNACLVRLDVNGMVLWTKTYSLGISDEYAYTVEQTSDGGFILGGEAYNNPGDAGLIIKTDASGTVQWAKTYGGSSDYWVSRIMPAGNGDYFVAGVASQPSYINIWLARLDNSGTQVWSNTYAGPGGLEDNCIWATRTSDGGFAMCGATNSFTTDYESFLLKTDSTGGPEWSKRYGGNGNDNSSQVIQTSDGGYILSSNTLSFGTAASAYLIKTYSNGGTGCNENLPAFIISTVTTQVSVVTATTLSHTNSTTPVIGYAAASVTENILCLTVGDNEINSDDNEIIIYPNPAGSEFRIHPDASGRIESVEIYDVFGKRVYSVPQTTNHKSQTIYISSLAKGIYFVRVRTEQGEVVRKLVKE